MHLDEGEENDTQMPPATFREKAQLMRSPNRRNPRRGRIPSGGEGIADRR